MTTQAQENQSFPRTARLLSPADFQRVFKKPKKFHSRLFSIYAQRNTGVEPRLGLAISKKALPRAVSRNRVKRLIRESFRKNRWQFCAVDVIFVARNDLRAATNEQVFSELDSVWKKLANYCASS